jgi:tripartite-type tricarboxylate transporter receptor subunit TctC
VNIWWGLTAPPGTPEPVLAKLRSAVDQMMNDPKTLERIRKLGFEPDYLPASDFKAFVIKEVEQWKQLAKSANIKLSQ